MNKFGFLGLAAAALMLSACGTSSKTGTGSDTSGRTGPGSIAEFQQSVGDRVHFGFDQYSLDSEARATLQRQASWLNQYNNYQAVIEGHADERGTREYNLALGERRANSVREFLVGQGVAGNRLRVISYGKERPVCTQASESCFQQNRRGVTVPQ